MLARGLGPSGRGTIAFITVTALVLARVAGLGVGEATTVYAARRSEARGILLSNLVLFMLASSLLAAGLACAALLLLGDERPAGMGQSELAILVAGTLAAALVEAGAAFLLGCGRIRRLALITATASWVYPLLLAAIWLSAGLTVTRAALAWVAAEILRALLLLRQSAYGVALVRPKPGPPPGHDSVWDQRLGRELRALPQFPDRPDPDGPAGVRRRARHLRRRGQCIGGAPVPACGDCDCPAARRSGHRAGAEQRGRQTLRAFRSAALVTTGAVVVAAILGPLLLPVVFGTAFRASVEPFLWLLPGALGFAATAVFSNALLAARSPGLSSLGHSYRSSWVLRWTSC